MKKLFVSLVILLAVHQAMTQDLTGAWKTDTPDATIVMICTDKYFAATVYSLADKTFKATVGGTYVIKGNKFVEVQEFNTREPDKIGVEQTSEFKFRNNEIVFTEGDGAQTWTRIDAGKPGALSGAWLITGRMEGGSMNKINPGARRTMKILSGTRFQWIAYNVETREFFGTGGGTYTTEKGKYTETIEFFSRDNSRVGKSLQFDYSLENGNWRHKGFSSKGDPIDEVWSKRENVQL
jgi:hypothetical protein